MNTNFSHDRIPTSPHASCTTRETDSLVEAAERLRLTQSALSHQFRELEEHMGLQLFVRKSKPVRFTSAGLRLLQLADEVLPLIRSTERDLSRLAGGTGRASAPGYRVPQLLPVADSTRARNDRRDLTLKGKDMEKLAKAA